MGEGRKQGRRGMGGGGWRGDDGQVKLSFPVGPSLPPEASVPSLLIFYFYLDSPLDLSSRSLLGGLPFSVCSFISYLAFSSSSFFSVSVFYSSILCH